MPSTQLRICQAVRKLARKRGYTNSELRNAYVPVMDVMQAIGMSREQLEKSHASGPSVEPWAFYSETNGTVALEDEDIEILERADRRLLNSPRGSVCMWASTHGMTIVLALIGGAASGAASGWFASTIGSPQPTSMTAFATPTPATTQSTPFNHGRWAPADHARTH